MTLVQHAEMELARIRGDEPDEMQDLIEENILNVVKAFSDGGHSGFSASYASAIIEKLLRFEPISPLQGTEDEWQSISEDIMGRPGVEQNIRCGRVFRKEGQAYDIEGIVFIEPDGDGYTSKDSSVDIEFPYIPKTEYVDRPYEEVE